jgi:hypothetical protein
MTAIRLQDGTEIQNCEQEILRYSNRRFEDRTDRSYRNYDRCEPPVIPDCSLVEHDIRVANKMQARMSSKVCQLVLNKRVKIESALKRIPPDCDLADDDVPWNHLTELFDATIMKGVRLARATKILHKKRPRLIPILDSVIQKYASKMPHEASLDDDDAKRAIASCRVIKKDLQSNRQALQAIQSNLKGIAIDNKRIELSRVRILDILIWMKKKNDA